MYKIAVFSDIHGNYEALSSVIKEIKKYHVDETICLGDVIGYGPSPKECVDLILKSNTKWILGNHDLYFAYKDRINEFKVEKEKMPSNQWTWSQLDDSLREKISKNPREYILNKEGHTFTFCHYFIKDINDLYPFYSIVYVKSRDLLYLSQKIKTDYFLYGHDHSGFQIQYKDKKIIDVGSSGCMAGTKTYFTLISIDKNVDIEKIYVDYDSDTFKAKLRANEYYDFIRSRFK